MTTAAGILSGLMADELARGSVKAARLGLTVSAGPQHPCELTSHTLRPVFGECKRLLGCRECAELTMAG
jgi:hypothetical protein